MPYGTVTDHGTMFVGFAPTRGGSRAMLESMAGLASGVRDALTRYTQPAHGRLLLRPLGGIAAPVRPRHLKRSARVRSVSAVNSDSDERAPA